MTGFLIQIMSGSGFRITRLMHINCVARVAFPLKDVEVRNIGPDSQRVQTSSDVCGDALSYPS